MSDNMTSKQLVSELYAQDRHTTTGPQADRDRLMFKAAREIERLQQRISELESDLYVLRNERDNLRDNVDYLKTETPSVESAPASKQVIGSAELWPASDIDDMQHQGGRHGDSQLQSCAAHIRDLQEELVGLRRENIELRKANVSLAMRDAHEPAAPLPSAHDVWVRCGNVKSDDVRTVMRAIMDLQRASAPLPVADGPGVSSELLQSAWLKYGRHLHDCQRRGEHQCTCGFVETCMALGNPAPAVVSQSDCDEIAGILATQEHGPACECSACISTELRKMEETIGPAVETRTSLDPRPPFCRLSMPPLPEPDPCEWPDCHCKQIAEAMGRDRSQELPARR